MNSRHFYLPPVQIAWIDYFRLQRNKTSIYLRTNLNSAPFHDSSLIVNSFYFVSWTSVNCVIYPRNLTKHSLLLRIITFNFRNASWLVWLRGIKCLYSLWIVSLIGVSVCVCQSARVSMQFVCQKNSNFIEI